MSMSDDARPLRLVAAGIALAAVAVLLFMLASLVWSVLQLFIIAALLTLALEHPVRGLTARRVPRGLAVALVIVGALALLGLFIALLAPRLIAQGQQFLLLLPQYWTGTMARLAPLLVRYPQLATALSADHLFEDLRIATGGWLSAARSIFVGAVGTFTAAILVLVATIYALLQPLPLLYGLRGLFPTSWWPTLGRIGTGIGLRIRGWVIGTLLLSLIIGLLDFFALTLINLLHKPEMPFVVTFAVISGVLEIIPIVGPIVATALPALVGFSIDPILGLVVILAFFLVQQLENHLVAPLVMQKTVNLHPVSLLFTLVILSALYGLFGAIIAVPTAAVLKVLYDEWYYPLLHDGRHPEAPPPDSGAKPARE